MFFNVVNAEYIRDYTIRLTFSNGKSGVVDLETYIADGEIYSGIRTREDFREFSVEFGTLVWKGGDIDIAPETLYEKATGEKIVFPQDQIHRAM